MRPKAIRDLVQLRDSALFEEIAKGLQLVAKNVARLSDGRRALAEASMAHAARVLGKMAEEEASKYFILLDAVRCPRQPQPRLVSHLGRFHDHLAKGLYAKACMYRPSSLGQLQEYLDLDRNDFYLDGFHGVEWVFRNDVTGGREDALYCA
jgi:hypothetical protein